MENIKRNKKDFEIWYSDKAYKIWDNKQEKYVYGCEPSMRIRNSKIFVEEVLESWDGILKNGKIVKKLSLIEDLKRIESIGSGSALELEYNEHESLVAAFNVLEKAAKEKANNVKNILKKTLYVERGLAYNDYQEIEKAEIPKGWESRGVKYILVENLRPVGYNGKSNIDYIIFLWENESIIDSWVNFIKKRK